MFLSNPQVNIVSNTHEIDENKMMINPLIVFSFTKV